MMILLIVVQVLGQKWFMERKENKGDPILLLIKFVTPSYAFFVFVVNMECLEWGRVTFYCSLCVGVMFICVNYKDMQRGVTRND